MGISLIRAEVEPSSHVLRLLMLCSLPLSRRPSGIPEADLRSTMVPYFLQQRDALRRQVQRLEAENRQLADAVLAGRRQVEELQLQGQAQWQAWQVSALALPSGTCSPAAAEEKIEQERSDDVGTLWGPIEDGLALGKPSLGGQRTSLPQRPAECRGEGPPYMPFGAHIVGETQAWRQGQ